jgi:arylsulfatase A-like enzyme
MTHFGLRCGLISLICAGTLFAAERPPNIVLIVADDLGWGDVGFNGRTEWNTPNLDRLASQGMLFRRWYVGAVVCAPSRACFLTGKYGIHNGVTTNSQDLPAEEITIAEALKPAGYSTALFGKWHHGQPRRKGGSYVHPMDQGFDEFFGFTDAREAWQHFPKQLWYGREQKQSSGYVDRLFADAAIEFIRRRRETPFFLYLPFTTPHLLIEAPPEDVAEHRGKFPERDPNKPLNATYAAMVTRQDKEIGRVLAALDERKLAEQTLVVFFSDHGATFEAGNQGTSAALDSNRPFRGQKRTLWEGGVRVPGVVRWPGKIAAGTVSNDPTHSIDLLPTLLAAADRSPEAAWKVDGTNLLPVWLGKSRAPERTLCWEWRSEGYYQLAAMRGDWKLVVTGANPPELFNVDTDPAERRSRAAEQPDLVSRLKREVGDWLATERTDAGPQKVPAGPLPAVRIPLPRKEDP